MFHRILVPTDGSAAVEPAISAAFELAGTCEASLHVLFIVDQPASVSAVGEGFQGLDDLLEGLASEGRKVTNEIVARAEARGIEARAAVRRGNPYDDILAYAEAHEMDLIVLGTHGRTGLKRAMLGSVTEAVVRHAEIPVLTVHRRPEG